MPFFPFWRRKPLATPPSPVMPPDPLITDEETSHELAIKRHFCNQPHFQCYSTYFQHWDGWISAGHCLTEASDIIPDFASKPLITWPDGLDAALLGVTLPDDPPAIPQIGRDVVIHGYPAGSRHLETRHGKIYLERQPGTWIAHIENPDEPVVTGMSGGPVIDVGTGEPIGIVITRNSPADLNRDRDPDESCDFIALASVWEAVARENRLS